MSGPASQLADRVVLVVDDDDVVCRMMARVLMDAGFHVSEAHSGEEAFDRLSRLGPTVIGLIVSDIAMSCMTGLELAKVVAERWSTVLILLLSGQGEPPTSYVGPFLPKLILAASCSGDRCRIAGLPNPAVDRTMSQTTSYVSGGITDSQSNSKRK